VNKNDITRSVYEIHGGISFADARKIVDLILSIIKERLVDGDKVLISGFGSFRVVNRKERRGVDPQTGMPMVIPGRKVVVFRPSKYLKSL